MAMGYYLHGVWTLIPTGGKLNTDEERAAWIAGHPQNSPPDAEHVFRVVYGPQNSISYFTTWAAGIALVKKTLACGGHASLTSWNEYSQKWI